MKDDKIRVALNENGVAVDCDLPGLNLNYKADWGSLVECLQGAGKHLDALEAWVFGPSKCRGGS